MYMANKNQFTVGENSVQGFNLCIQLSVSWLCKVKLLHCCRQD